MEDMTSATDTIKLLELQRSKFVTGEKYLQATEVVSQITEWRGKQRKLQAELSKLQKADARSMKYHKGKSAKGRAELKTMERFIISKSKGPSDVSTSSGSCSSTESTSSEADVNDAVMQNGTPSECCSAGKNVASSSRAFSTKSTSSEVDVNDVVICNVNVKEDCIQEELGIFCGNDSKSDSDESESSDDETSENGSDTGCPDDVDSENNGQNSDVPPNSSALDPDVIMKGMATVSPAPGNEHLLMLLRENNHNWFSFVGELKMLLHMYTPEVLNQVLVDFAAFLPFSDLSDEEERLVEQSQQAFLMTERRRVAREDDDVLSDSESDDPEDWVDVGQGLTEKIKSLVVNEKRKQKKRDRRRFRKLVAEKSVLKRRVPKRASKLLKQFPNLGKNIEDFVHANQIGADAWRGTGVATFDGNVKSGPCVTYRRIKEHLERKYQRKFSYGAIVQLSVVWNKRRQSSKRYWGAAQITCRRA